MITSPFRTAFLVPECSQLRTRPVTLEMEDEKRQQRSRQQLFSSMKCSFFYISQDRYTKVSCSRQSSSLQCQKSFAGTRQRLSADHLRKCLQSWQPPTSPSSTSRLIQPLVTAGVCPTLLILCGNKCTHPGSDHGSHFILVGVGLTAEHVVQPPCGGGRRRAALFIGADGGVSLLSSWCY